MLDKANSDTHAAEAPQLSKTAIMNINILLTSIDDNKWADKRLPDIAN